MIDNIKAMLAPKRKRAIRRTTPSPYPAAKIVFKPGALESVMQLKGWRSYTQMADALGYTRQYISFLAGGGKASDDFICRLTVALGNNADNWHEPFTVIPARKVPDNHPLWNQAKYEGKIPYQPFSPTATERAKDYKVETKKLLANDV
jgi:hypothetical protein